MLRLQINRYITDKNVPPPCEKVEEPLFASFCCLMSVNSFGSDCNLLICHKSFSRCRCHYRACLKPRRWSDGIYTKHSVQSRLSNCPIPTIVIMNDSQDLARISHSESCVFLQMINNHVFCAQNVGIKVNSFQKDLREILSQVKNKCIVGAMVVGAFVIALAHTAGDPLGFMSW